MSGRTALPTTHHSTPAPQQLPEELLLAKHVLVRRDGHTTPLSAAYDGPFLVLERSLRYFKLQVGNKTDTFSTLSLKPCRSPPDVQVAQPPRRGRPPATPVIADTPAATPPSRKKPQRRRVTFRCPVMVSSSPPLLHPSGRPARAAWRPKRYLVSLSHLRRPQLGGEL